MDAGTTHQYGKSWLIGRFRIKIVVNQFTSKYFPIFVKIDLRFMYSWILKFKIKINRTALFEMLNVEF